MHNEKTPSPMVTGFDVDMPFGESRGFVTKRRSRGGDPESIRFCHHLALAYVSCSPYRIPVARLAAAHAKLEKQ